MYSHRGRPLIWFVSQSRHPRTQVAFGGAFAPLRPAFVRPRAGFLVSSMWTLHEVGLAPAIEQSFTQMVGCCRLVLKLDSCVFDSRLSRTRRFGEKRLFCVARCAMKGVLQDVLSFDVLRSLKFVFVFVNGLGAKRHGSQTHPADCFGGTT